VETHLRLHRFGVVTVRLFLSPFGHRLWFGVDENELRRSHLAQNRVREARKIPLGGPYHETSVDHHGTVGRLVADVAGGVSL
jgi:hypothetical protein